MRKQTQQAEQLGIPVRWWQNIWYGYDVDNLLKQTTFLLCLLSFFVQGEEAGRKTECGVC